MVQRVSAGFFFIPMDPSMERSRENHLIIKKKVKRKQLILNLNVCFIKLYLYIYLFQIMPAAKWSSEYSDAKLHERVSNLRLCYMISDQGKKNAELSLDV